MESATVGVGSCRRVEVVDMYILDAVGVKKAMHEVSRGIDRGLGFAKLQ